jgi:hypothetical protein
MNISGKTAEYILMFGTPVYVWYQKYIKADRFRFMILTAANKERKQI